MAEKRKGSEKSEDRDEGSKRSKGEDDHLDVQTLREELRKEKEKGQKKEEELRKKEEELRKKEEELRKEKEEHGEELRKEKEEHGEELRKKNEELQRLEQEVQKKANRLPEEQRNGMVEAFILWCVCCQKCCCLSHTYRSNKSSSSNFIFDDARFKFSVVAILRAEQLTRTP